MKKLLFIPLFFVVLTCPSLKAQNSLGIDSTNYIIPTTLNYNAAYTFLVNIKNYGPLTFSGPFDVVYGVDTGSFFLDTLVIDTLSATIAMGNEVSDSTSITVNVAGKMRSGINTVVIWPRTANSEIGRAHV